MRRLLEAVHRGAFADALASGGRCYGSRRTRISRRGGRSRQLSIVVGGQLAGVWFGLSSRSSSAVDGCKESSGGRWISTEGWTGSHQ